MKDLLEQISVILGYDGEINEQVNQWIDDTVERWGYSDSELLEYLQFVIVYWKNTGYVRV